MLCSLMYYMIAMPILYHIFLLIYRLYALVPFLSILFLFINPYLTAIMYLLMVLTILKTVDRIIFLKRIKHNLFIAVIGPVKLSLS